MSLWTVAAYQLAIVAGFLIANFIIWKLALKIAARIGPRLGFEYFVASRHLAGKKSWFVAIIGVFALLGVSASSCTLSTVLSVMGGFGNDLKEKILRAQSHVVVDRIDGRIEDYAQICKKIQALEEVVGATPLITGEVMLTSRINNAGAMIRGIDTEGFRQVSDMLDRLEKGDFNYVADPRLLEEYVKKRRKRWYGSASARDPTGTPSKDMDAAVPENPADDSENKTGAVVDNADKKKADGGVPVDPWIKRMMKPRAEKDARPVVIIGKELAQGLRVFVGDEINVISPLGDMGPTGPVPRRRTFRVGGVFNSGMYEYDSQYAFMRIDEAQKFLGSGSVAGEIHIKVHNPAAAPLIAGKIGKLIGQGYRIRSWQELNAALFSALNLEKIVMFIFLSMAIIVASFCILATLTMLVMEKSGEIAVLSTLGADRWTVGRIFKIEGLFIGVVGTLTGLAVGLCVALALDHLGFRIDPDVWYIDRLPVNVNPLEFLAVGIVSLLVSAVATWYPARAASTVDPVEGLRYE